MATCRDAWINDKLAGLVFDMKIKENGEAALYFWGINAAVVFSFWALLLTVLFSNGGTKWDAILTL